MTHRYSDSFFALLSPAVQQRVSLPPLSVLSEAELPPSYEPHSPIKHKRTISLPPATLIPSSVSATSTAQHQRSLTTVSSPSKQAHSNAAAQSPHLSLSTALAPSPVSCDLVSPTPAPQSDVASLSASFHSLVLQLHNRWLQQHAINTTNNTMHAFNFILHYASISRTVTLHKQQQHLQQQLHQHTQLLVVLEDRVAEAESTVGQLVQDMERMTEDAVFQNHNLSQLQLEVQQQRERVAEAMEVYEAKLAEQAEQMERQERALERLLLVRLRLDFGVDAVIVVLAFYLARLPMLRLVLFTVARQALPVRVAGLSGSGGLSVRGRRELVVGVGQLVVFAAVVLRARSWAVEKGLHNMVGTYSRYAAMALRTMQAAAYRMAEKDVPVKASEEESEKAEVSESVEADSKLLMLPASSESPLRSLGAARPVSPTSRPSAAALSARAANSPAAVALSLAGDAVAGVVTSVGSTVLGAGQLVGRLLTFGGEVPEEFRQPRERKRRD